MITNDDMAITLRLQKERATEYCETCGGSGSNRVCVTGSKLDFVRCETCKGTGRTKVFKNRKNREIFEV